MRALLCALALTLTACRPRPPQVPVVHDLVAELPAAEIRREVEVIDFGGPTSRIHLREGWYQNEGGGRRDRTVVWSRGPGSAVEFWLAAPRPLRATLRCAPFPPPDGQPQGVTVLLNGRRIGELSLRPKLNDYALALPTGAQAAGPNRLEFSYRRVTRFQHRQLAVSWDLLRLTPGPAAPAELPQAAVRPGSSTPTLVLPPGTEAGYYLALQGGGTFSLQGVRSQKSGGGALQVLSQEEGGQEKLLETLPAGTGPRSLPLSGRGERLVRLALRAVPSAGSRGGLVLLGPAVRGLSSVPRRETASGAPGPDRPNVIVYLVDTLRADRIGARRNGTSLTPHIDAFAQGATVFENMVAQASWTKPSVTSIFTGLGPLTHGVRRIHDKLPPEAVTAAELFHVAGYQTAGFSTNWHISHTTGLDQGFAFFDFAPKEPASDLLNQRVLRWLDRRRERSPLFLYVHALDPHAPYEPPPVYRARFASGIRPAAGTPPELKRIYKARGRERRRLMVEIPPLYDAEVAFNDRSFGELLDALRRHGLYDTSLILFVSDHGEEFDEHGDFGHGNNLFSETLHVPLMVKWPNQRQGRRVRSIAQHIDLLPTLLQAAGLRAPKNLLGIDLALVAASGDDPEAFSGRAVVSHLSRQGRGGISVIQAGWKLIHPLTRELSESPELYHLPTDRAERTNRLGELPVRAGWLESLVRREQDRGRSGLQAQTYEMDEETRKALEALGYL